jgi:hypothetical protein
MISRSILDAAARVAEHVARRSVVRSVLPAPPPGDVGSQAVFGDDATGTEIEEPDLRAQHPRGGADAYRIISP